MDDVVNQRIVHVPEIMGGRPTIRGTRLTVSLILEKLSYGETIENILADYSHISRDDVLACIAYAKRNVDEEIPILAAE